MTERGPDPSPSDPDTYALLNAGLALYHADLPFEAHEVWEHAWGAEIGRNKLTLQALIQIAAAMHKHKTKSPRGTCKLLAKAKDKIEEIQSGASSWLGIDLVGLEREVERALAEADRLASEERVEVVAPRLPRAVGRDGVLYLHGFASSPGSAKASVIVPELRARGLHVDVPDLNEGDFFHLTMTRALDLARRHVRERTLVIGSSLGGALGALLADKDERVKGLVLMAPAFSLAERLAARYGDREIARWRESGSIAVEHLGYGRTEEIGYGFFDDAQRHAGTPRIRVPTYVLHGERDDVVPSTIASELAERFPSFVELDLVDDDHALTASAERALRATLRMVDRLALQVDPAPVDPGRAMEELTSIESARAAVED
jgi:pimeloyl-ACP methyl ester carboxylesterase